MCAVHGPDAPCKCGYALGFAAFVLGSAISLGCDLLPAEAPDIDPCATEITRLEGLRAAEIAAACIGYTFDECPAVEGIDGKYDPLIAEQVRCDR